MTRFARVVKKTSLEATPWSELVISQSEKGLQGGNKSTNTDTTVSQDKKFKKSGKKRKISSNDEESSVSKTPRMTENTEQPCVEVKNKHGGTKLEKKDTRMKKDRTMNSVQHEQKMRKLTHGKQSKHGESFLNRKKAAYNSEILDRKKEARRKRRAKGKACFHCRQTGHVVSECPMAKKEGTGVGMCYRCGSSEHTTASCGKAASQGDIAYPFAKCFICGEDGHIARECPDNPKGLYPNGGACKLCGSVEHFRRDCPDVGHQSKSKGATAFHSQNRKGHFSADAQQEDDGETPQRKQAKQKGPRVVKF